MSLNAHTIASRIDGRTAADIAASIAQAIRAGEIPAASTLPTIRSLADALHTSPSTVSDAWRTLRHHGLIDTDRRRGTTVRADRPFGSERWWHVPVAPGTLELDLSTGTPDPALLPDLGSALGRVQIDHQVTSYLDRPLLPALEAELRRRWPFDPAAVTVLDGAQDALDRTITMTIGLGDRVVVETPTFPPLLDMLELAGADIVGVPVDAEGLEPGGLADALAEPTRAIFVQPRAHNPTGAAFTTARASSLAKLIEPTNALIVEDDHSGDVAGVPLVSLGRWLPDRTIHIHSFSKSHGPDLRLAAVGGAAEPISAIVRRRQLGASWTSRLLQQVLLALLTDPDAQAAVTMAAERYLARRRALGAALVQRGLNVEPLGTGLNLWIPVADEQSTVVGLAALGVGVAPGKPFEVMASATDHIRVTISTLDDPSELADALVATGTSGAVGYAPTSAR